MAESKKELFLGTVTFRLSDRNYLDVVRDGVQLNNLPVFTVSIGQAQTQLDNLEERFFVYRKESVDPDSSLEAGTYTFSEKSYIVQLSEFRVRSIAIEEGSVVAKAQLAATVVFLAYQGLADYKDFKEGFAELRNDVVQIVSNAFGVDGAGDVDLPGEPDTAELRYYFVTPNRFQSEMERMLSTDAEVLNFL